jgi:hypothetical protein
MAKWHRLHPIRLNKGNQDSTHPIQ